MKHWDKFHRYIYNLIEDSQGVTRVILLILSGALNILAVLCVLILFYLLVIHTAGIVIILLVGFYILGDTVHETGKLWWGREKNEVSNQQREMLP